MKWIDRLTRSRWPGHAATPSSQVFCDPVLVAEIARVNRCGHPGVRAHHSDDSAFVTYHGVAYALDFLDASTDTLDAISAPSAAHELVVTFLTFVETPL